VFRGSVFEGGYLWWFAKLARNMCMAVYTSSDDRSNVNKVNDMIARLGKGTL
jgi:hypothetical protein